MMEFLLKTGTGFWNPLMMLFSAIIITSLVYFMRSFGEKKYRKDTKQTIPFFAGGFAPSNVRVGNTYWGFEVYLERYYNLIKRFHNGSINDYIYWFILTLIIILTVMAFGGFS